MVAGVVQDTNFAQRPGEGSQLGYCVLRSSADLFNGEAMCHFMDWGSGRIHRAVRSTLAAEAASASHAADRATYLRALISEFLYGYSYALRSMVALVKGFFCNGMQLSLRCMSETWLPPFRTSGSSCRHP
jgi:hypothetical protein